MTEPGTAESQDNAIPPKSVAEPSRVRHSATDSLVRNFIFSNKTHNRMMHNSKIDFASRPEHQFRDAMK
jgi:hypothetical protein